MIEPVKTVEPVEPEEDLNLEKYLEDFTPEELKSVQDLLQSKKSINLKQLSDDIYRVPCPSPREFLDEWVGYAIKRGLFPWVKKTFIDIWDYEKNYTEAVLYGATRCHGKDTPILMYDGSIKMVQDVKVGDTLYGDDFGARNVVEIVNGRDQLYLVEQEKGLSNTINVI